MYYDMTSGMGNMRRQYCAITLAGELTTVVFLISMDVRQGFMTFSHGTDDYVPRRGQ